MILTIDTIQGDEVEITIKKTGGILYRKRFNAEHKQAEKLLPEISLITIKYAIPRNIIINRKI